MFSGQRVSVRRAEERDADAIRAMQDASMLRLAAHDYGEVPLEALIESGGLFDPLLIEEGTLLVAEAEGRIIGSAAWSERTTSAGDPGTGDGRLWTEPGRDPARIRSVFVHPDWARCGIATRLMQAVEDAAATAGYDAFLLVATLTGTWLYRQLGYEEVAPFRYRIPGFELPAVIMIKTVGGGEVERTAA